MIKHYAIISFSGEGYPIAKKLQDEGCDVMVGMIEKDEETHLPEEMKNYSPENPETKKRRLTLYEGIFKRYPAQELINFLKKQSNKEEWFVFFDFNYCFKYAKQLMGMGFKGNFPTEEDRRLEENRDYAKDFVKKNYPDITVAEKHQFKTLEECQKFLENTTDLWVVKPFNDDAKSKVPESQDPETAKQEILNAIMSDQEKYEADGFEIELKIPQCIEITPQKVYYDGVPLYTNMDIELKRIGASEIGPMTGCAADLIFKTEMDEKINQIAFPPIVDAMAKKHEGLFVWDLSILVDPVTEKYYMGEFCSNRVGYNAFYTELCMMDKTYDWFDSVSVGQDPYKQHTPKFGASIRLFYLDKGGSKPDKKISGDLGEYCWTMDMKKVGEDLLTCGYLWDIAVVTGVGDTIDEAVNFVYENLDRISYDGKYYRPKEDYLSMSYFNSIPRRYIYGNHKLFNSVDYPSFKV